jgi:glycosyltransferase involved in cell wall biosynthesis
MEGTGSSAPVVSVIIPTHNRVRLLDRAVRSVLAQTFRDLELIIIDDASSDATQAYVRELRDPRVRSISHERNRGVSAARNTGIANARGRYIAFQDSDDEWLVEKLEHQLAIMEKQGAGCGMVGCELLRYIGGPLITVRWAEEPADRERISACGHVAAISAFIQTTLFRRECLEDIGTFDESLWVCEDWELTLRAVGKWSFGNVPEPLVISYETLGSLSSFPDRRSFALRRILDRHGALIRADRRAYARFLSELAKADFYSRDPSAARKVAAQAIAANWREPRAWVLLATSFFSASFLLWLIARYRAAKLRLGLYR